MDGGAVQSVPDLSPNDSWGGLQPSSNPEHNKENGQMHTCYWLSTETKVRLTGGPKRLQLSRIKTRNEIPVTSDYKFSLDFWLTL